MPETERRRFDLSAALRDWKTYLLPAAAALKVSFTAAFSDGHLDIYEIFELAADSVMVLLVLWTRSDGHGRRLPRPDLSKLDRRE